MKPLLSITPLIVALLTLLALPLHAEKEYGMSDGQVTVTATASHQFEEELDNTGGQELSNTAQKIEVDYTGREWNGILSLGGFYEHTEYDFNRGAQDLDVDSLGARLFTSQNIQDEWGWFGFGGIKFTADDRASLSDGDTYFVSGGATYQFADNFRLSAGASVSTQIEDDVQVLPALSIEWDISERLSMRTANGVFFEYDWFGDEETVVDFSVAYESKDIRLEKTGAAGERALQDRSFDIAIGATQSFYSGWFIRPGLTLKLDRELETKTERLGSSELQQGTNIGVSISGGYAF